jgi:Zn finger protein HypA/HybF involved in hydrogenase expression
MISIEEIEYLKNYYVNNNKSIPKTVKAYESDFPTGFGRTSIKTKFGLSCKQLLALLNNDSSLSKDINYWVDILVKRFDIEIQAVEQRTQVRKSIITFKCKDCGFVQKASVESLNLRIFGCTSCKSKNAKIKDNPKNLYRALEDKKLILIDELPDNQLDKIKVKCKDCSTEFSVITVKVMHPQTDYTATCPNCRVTDTRVVYDKQLFGSQIERDVYLELCKYTTAIHRQVRYASLAKCSRKWVMDMLIDNTIIEVSNFSKDPHNNNYYNNLKDKKNWATANGFRFVHISKVSQVKELVKDIVWATS